MILDKHWLDYMTTVIPADTDNAVRQQCEQAYYAGAAVVLKVLGRIVGGPQNPMPPAVARVVNRLCEEIIQFSKHNIAVQERNLLNRAGKSTNN